MHSRENGCVTVRHLYLTCPRDDAYPSAGTGGGDVLHTAAVSLPYRHGAYIPCPPLNCRRRFTSASSACFYVDAGHTDFTTHHAG